MPDTSENTALDRDQDPLDREYAPGWAPEPGDKVRGIFNALEERRGDFGRYPIYTLALTDGYSARIKTGELVTVEVAIHAQRDVLQRKLANARLRIGEEVGVKYVGPPLGTARSHRYRVVKYLPDGGFVEAPYDPYDELDADPDDVGATQQALEEERQDRDAALSDAESDDRDTELSDVAKVSRAVNRPLETDEAA